MRLKYTFVNGVAHLVTEYGPQEFKTPDVGTLSPRNEEQRCAIHAALNPANAVLAFEGEPGTGKTAIVTACFLHRATKNKKLKVGYTRLTTPMGRSMGYLPGDVSEKFGPFLQAFHDQTKLVPHIRVRDMLAEQKIFFPPIEFIKGRTFDDTLLIVDEAQDLHPLIAEAILARMGQNSVVAFIGDRNQIDERGLTPEFNGLVHVSNLGLEPDVAYVRLVTPERGRGAQLAVQLRKLRLEHDGR